MCSTAQAATPSQADYIQFAETVWPDSPCNGQETVTWVTGFDDPDRGGEADDGTCNIRIKTSMGVYTTCRLFVHELGHTAGYRDISNVADTHHSSDPHNIMAAMVPPYQPCADRFGQQIAEEKVHDPCRLRSPKVFVCGKARIVQMFGGIAVPYMVARNGRSSRKIGR
jgi:hypothetical protein